ncbi:MAG TPA: DUF5666 domain-containing protein [bacterium]|nr:DUF5666 domain-containing protein [bacterium]
MQRLRYYPLLIALIAVVAAGVAFTTVRMHASAQTQTPSQTGQPHRGNRVFGTIQSVSADSFVVTGRDGKTYTVKTTATTKVLTQSAARLNDVRAGDMVRVLATKGQDGSLTAVAVQDLPAGLAVGGGRGGPRDGAAGNAANSNRVFVAGSVVRLSGTSLSIASRGGAATTVAVPASARISRMTTAPWTSLAAGARVSAMGTLNPDGSLAASTVMVLPASR